METNKESAAAPFLPGSTASNKLQVDPTIPNPDNKPDSPVTPASDSPSPVTPESIRKGAGITSADIPTTPLATVRKAVGMIEPVDLRELANRYYGYAVLDTNGREREQTLHELTVLLVKHFECWSDDVGLGARVLNGEPHLFGGTHWKPVLDRELENLLGRFALRLGCDPVQFGHFAAREKLIKQYHSTHGGKPEDHPSRASLVNFRNGTLEISDDGELLRGFRKDDLLHYQLPFDYDPQAECPMFDKFLLRVLPDQASRMVLAEFIGWLFLPDLKLEKVLVLFGDGHNGKSVFFDIICALLGEHNVTNYGLSSLSKMENRCALGSALLNFGSEINERCDADLFKKMASGEPIEARRLYHDAYIMRDYARLAFNANLLPRDTEHTTGFFRRFHIIPFDQTISEEEKDPELARKIIGTELSGVFNWVMGGLRRLRLQKKFTQCVAADQALATYKLESDSTAGFLEEGSWQPREEHRIGKGELYRAYQDYCRDSGHRPLSKPNFGKRLIKTHRVHESKSGGVRFWHLYQAQQH